MAESERSLVARVAAAMAEIKAVPKRGENKFAGYTYATADDVYDALRPILARHEITVSQRVHGIETIAHRGVEFLVLYVATFLDGDDIADPVPVPLNTTGKKGVRLDAQAVQAALTYAEKYFLRGRFLVATGDPDIDAEAPQEIEAPVPTEAAPDATIVLDGHRMVMDTGETLLSWAQDGGRPAQTAVYRYTTDLITERPDEHETILDANMTALVAIIPRKGRLVLANAMQSAGMEPELIERLIADTKGDAG